MRKNVVTTLMERDGISEQEAKELVQETKSEMMELIEEGRFDEAYESCEYLLGLEPDYIEDIIG